MNPLIGAYFLPLSSPSRSSFMRCQGKFNQIFRKVLNRPNNNVGPIYAPINMDCNLSLRYRIEPKTSALKVNQTFSIKCCSILSKKGLNKYFAAVINHARFLFPTTGHVHESYNTSHKFLDCLVIDDTQIRTLVRAPHVYFDQSPLRILCDVTVRILRSDFVQVVVARISTRSAPRCILLASCHYHNYSCVLVLLILIFDSCRYCLSMTQTRSMSSQISNIIDDGIRMA